MNTPGRRRDVVVSGRVRSGSGPGSVVSERDAVRRLVERVGLGPAPGEVDTAARVGFAATLAGLTTPGSGADPGVAATPVPVLSATTRLGGPPVGADAVAARRARRRALAVEGHQLGVWWLDRMVAVRAPFGERMTWLWHTHFATSIQKVLFPTLMFAQNDTFRRLGRGDFAVLAQAMIVDPAMLIWLDGQGNRVGKPNENLAREFMELFTLGVGHYTEGDVRAAARALTGWRLDYTSDTPVFTPRAHDPGPETVLGQTGGFDAEALVGLLLAQPSSPVWVITRLWTRLVSDTPPDPATMTRLITVYGPTRDITAVVRAMVNTPQFRDPASVLVKEPVLWLVGALRALRVPASRLPTPALAAGLRGLGQVPFVPPNVGGWPAGLPWLTTAAALTRLRLAQQITAAADLSPVTDTPVSGRVQATTELLGMPTLTERTRTALAPLAAHPQLLVAMAMASPEYTISA